MSTPQASAKPTIPASLAQFDDLPDSAHVRLPIVAALYGVSTPTIWRWSKAGSIPSAKKIGPNTTAWNVGELRRSRELMEAI
jgi:predicted DNA-binding transcriptional regulator AlpA